MKRRLFRNRDFARSDENDNVNPLEGMANLADIMLIFAVGLMLALIINWRVEISPPADSAAEAGAAVSFSGEDVEPVEGEENPSSDEMERLGTVYYDAQTDTYYIIPSGAQD